ncbi:MAG: hypothetical protein P4M00_11610, partial [Azospirillaceae bacterium]|nr:hypothetical protein [Azospirillaceae bacterium]
MASNRVATGNISGIVIGHDNRGTIIQYNVLGSSGANERIEIFLPAPASDAATTNRFTFTARRTGWAGRDAEMAQLAGFRDRSEPFLWWLVAGAGGTGKSRLALEFCSESATPCPPDSRRSPSWWARIFGRKPSEPTPEPRWHCGFLPLSEAQKDTDAPRLTRLAEPWKLWQPDRPTLIVIDYVVQRPRFTGQLVHALAQRSDLAHPVRLLLLERDAKGSWQQDFRAPDQITQSSVDATRHAEALELRAPGDDALWSIIHTMSGDRATDRTEALTQLREIDSKTRPLFAAFLGDAMGHDRPPRHWDRDALFDDVIRRYRDHFWTPAGVTDADESLLCLATLTSGAFSSWLQNPEPRPPAFPVPLPAINRDLERRYQAMTGAPVTEIDDPDNPILFPPLQPDLLGEFFVLRHLTTETGATWRSSLRAWLNASWSLDPGGTAVFLDRLGADFADDKHIPAFFEMPPSQALPVRHFWAMLIVNRGFRLGQLGRGAEAIAVYDTVIERFENAPEAALREQVATALVNKGVTLGQLGRSAEAIAVYDTVIERFENAPEAALREQVATALRNKGFRLGQLGHSAEAIAVYDTLIERFENAPEAALREQVATALRNKGFRLGQLGHSAEAIAV